jgi:hypothetical protein
MKLVETSVVSRVSGKVVPARVAVCSNCQENKFIVFIIGKSHQHLQCAHCDETYCDGSCAREEKL